jgi:DNA-binding MarR family transcriptional regulator
MRECNLTGMAARKGPLDDVTAIEALIQAGGALARVLDDAVRRAGGVGLSQHNVLARLAHADPIPLEPRQIAAATGSGSAHVTMLLDQLEKAGLLERRPHASDRRRREVVLTDAGRECVAATAAALEVTARGVLARARGVSPGDLLAVSAALDHAVGDVGGPLTADAAVSARARKIPGGR